MSMNGIDVLATIQFLKPDWNGLVWENDINQIQPNEQETFRPTISDLLAVDQTQVAARQLQEEENQKQITLDQILQKIQELQQQVQKIIGESQ